MSERPDENADDLRRFLDSTWYTLGYPGPPSDPYEQTKAGLEYIRSRYGKGGWLPPGQTWAVNNTSEPEPVLPPEEPPDEPPQEAS